MKHYKVFHQVQFSILAVKLDWRVRTEDDMRKNDVSLLISDENMCGSHEVKAYVWKTNLIFPKEQAR